MANIVPKLNLNKTPNLVENNSLIFAKNIRLDATGTIHKDFSLKPINTFIEKDTPDRQKTYQYEDLLDKIIYDITVQANNLNEDENFKKHCNDVAITLYNIKHKSFKNCVDSNYEFVGQIPYSKGFYLFIGGYSNIKSVEDNNIILYKQHDYITHYNEETNTFELCNCNWIYSGGSIDGEVITNLANEIILIVIEKPIDNKLIPIKSINLNKSNFADDESLYTQTPITPVINLKINGYFGYSIPNGVYQFYIRYKIREDFYTDWFPASKELAIGNRYVTNTNFGSVGFTNIHTDTDKSFVFLVDDITLGEYSKNYKSFQIGFILSHDDSILGRAWKHFDLGTSVINFDYKGEESTEIEITEFTKSIYNLYNVNNITLYNNKLYISNYIETDFNTNLQEYADKVKISLVKKEYDQTTYLNPVENSNYYDGIKITNSINDTKVLYFAKTGDLGSSIIDTLFNAENHAIKNILQNQLDTLLSFDLIKTQINKTVSYKDVILSLYASSIMSTYTQHLQANKLIAVDNPSFPIEDISIEEFGETPTNDNSNTYTNSILDIVKTHSCWVDSNGNFVDKAKKPSGKYTFVIRRKATGKYKQIDPNRPGLDGNGNYQTDLVIIGKPKATKAVADTTTKEFIITQRITLDLSISQKYFENGSDYVINYDTLIPYQSYAFYIHYCKNTGEYTNGFKCNFNQTVIDEQDCRTIIYPKFENIILPKGYTHCFFSIVHTKGLVSTIFNVNKIEQNNTTFYEGNSLDVNLSNVPVIKEVACKSEGFDYNAEYHDSANGEKFRYFGANGIIRIEHDNKTNNNIENKTLYTINTYNSNLNEDTALIKCTPFINLNNSTSDSNLTSLNYDDYNDLVLLGHICKVYNLDKEQTINYFSDGTNLYKKNFSKELDDGAYNLTELSVEGDGSNWLGNRPIFSTEPFYIYSNYNLNYLTLTENIRTVIKSISFGTKEVEGVTVANTLSRAFRLINSMNNSALYTLPSMYKNYTRKYYSVYNSKNNKISFDNTIRSSVLYGDEELINIFRFNANDYYNIPTNKGIITNIIAIADRILVHTEHSMFAFSGTNGLVSYEGEISLDTRQPFDNGIKELFGAKLGFAGLQSKNNQILTEQGYIFFEKDTKSIYLYDGQNTNKLHNDIAVLLKHKNIIDIYFANDFYNNRFFISICFDDYNYTTLSYSLLENKVGFISLHDFKFTKTFNTKANCYFYSPNDKNIYTIDKLTYGYYGELETTDNIYPQKFYITTKNIYTKSLKLENGKVIAELAKIPTSIEQNIYNSIVDIIDNTNYETIKTLNNIVWSSSFISKLFETSINDTINKNKTADIVLSKKPCSALLIYSDNCITKIIEIEDISNNFSIYNTSTYKYPRFNQGLWAFNYFRDIENINDEFNYSSKYEDGRIEANPRPDYNSDINSLIEGKYFVVRFYFDKEFKLETLITNFRNKL